MSQQVILDESVEVARPVHEAFAYLAEFSRIEEWDPAVARGTRLTDGPIGVGTEFRVDMKIGLSLRYRVVEIEPGRRLLMSVDSSFFTAIEEIQLAPTPTGTRIRYVATFQFFFTAALMARTFPGMMDRVGKATMAGIKRALDDREATPEPSRAVALTDRLILPGLLRFTRLGYERARQHWKPFSAFIGGRHIVITGATSGLGLATAKLLAARGADLTLVARDPSKAQRVADEITQATGNARITVEIADLSLMADVHALADRLLEGGRPVDVLINNAGALIEPRQSTSEGLEKSFALLLLSPYILTERLQPLLKKATRVGAVGAGAIGARVVNVLSGGMYAEGIVLDDLQNERGPYSGSVAYARAKRGLMIMTELWADRFRADGIVVNAMHPGWADTPGVESSLPTFHRVTRSVLRTPEEGADTIVWLAAATEAGKVTGAFWLDREQHPAHVLSRTRETQDDRSALSSALADLAKR